jgi:hypothetical protein
MYSACYYNIVGSWLAGCAVSGLSERLNLPRALSYSLAGTLPVLIEGFTHAGLLRTLKTGSIRASSRLS